MSIIESILRSWRGKASEQEIEEELRFHIEMRTRDNIAAGMTPEEAKADALRRFGDFERVSDECREIVRQRLLNGATMKAMRGIAWVMFGCGLTLILSSSVHTVRQAGQMLVCIAVFWWLLLYLRATRPDQHRINQHLEVSEQTPLGLSPPCGVNEDRLTESSSPPAALRDNQGRSPVERLLAEDEQHL